MLRLFSALVVLFFVTGCDLIDSYTYTMSVLPLDAAFAINKSGAIAGRAGRQRRRRAASRPLRP